MALYQVASGASIVILDINQFYALLTGTMTDQDVTLAKGLKLGTLDPGAGPDLHSDGTNIYLETNGAGTIHLRPNGYGSDTNAATLANDGTLTTPKLTSSGAAILSSTLAVTSNTTVGGTLGVTGATTVGGTLGVTGATTLSGGATIPDAQTITFGGASGRIFEIGQFSVSYSNNSNPSTFDNLALQLNYHGRSIYVVACPVAGSPNPTTVMASQGTNPNTAKLQVTSGSNTSLTFNYIAAG